jgi:hypothetical protein
MGLRMSDGPRAEVRAAQRTSGQRHRSSARGGTKESGGEAADERARAVSGRRRARGAGVGAARWDRRVRAATHERASVLGELGRSDAVLLG